MIIPVIPEADAFAEAIRDLQQIPDSLAPASGPELGFRVMLEACLRHDGCPTP